MKLEISPSDLDKQSLVTLDGWVDIDSERWRETDDNPSFTKKIIRLLLNDGLYPDSMGRLWGKSKNSDTYYPFHYEYGKKKYGIRMSVTAVN